MIAKRDVEESQVTNANLFWGKMVEKRQHIFMMTLFLVGINFETNRQTYFHQYDFGETKNRVTQKWNDDL